MFAAVSAADAGTLKRVFFTDTPQSADLASAYANLIVSARRLRESVRLKYSADTPNPAMVRDGTTPGSAPPEQAAQLAAATVEIDGDTATVHIPDRPMPIKLRMVVGNWLIDLADFAAANPQQLSEQAEIDHSLATVMQETADEITAGKYASAQEAESAIQQKIHAVIAPQIKALAATMASTAPANTPPTTSASAR